MTIAPLANRLAHTLMARCGLRRLSNRLQYGPNAPRPWQRLRLAPNQISARYYVGGNNGIILTHWHSGLVLDGDWDKSQHQFEKYVKYRSCEAHFRDGTPWRETPAMPYGLKRLAALGKYDACYTEADLINRYEALDGLWHDTIEAGALPARAHSKAPRHDCILVHIGRDGTPMFGNKGFHRLSIAKLAGVKDITVMVGIVHQEAVENGVYAELCKQFSV